MLEFFCLARQDKILMICLTIGHQSVILSSSYVTNVKVQNHSMFIGYENSHLGSLDILLHHAYVFKKVGPNNSVLQKPIIIGFISKQQDEH